MQLTSFTALLALASSAAALTVVAPSMGEMVDFSKDFTVQWTSVNTDPSTFKISVVNQAGGASPFAQTVTSSVNTADGKYTIAGNTITAPAGKTYQVNLEANSGMTTGILAQSQQFNITTGGESSSSSSSASSSVSSTTVTESSTGEMPTTMVSTSIGESTTVTSTSTGVATATSASTKTTAASTTFATPTPGAAIKNIVNSLGLAAFVVGGALLA